MGGSSSQPRPWSNVTGPMSCGRVFPRLNKQSSTHSRVPCRGALLFCSLFGESGGHGSAPISSSGIWTFPVPMTPVVWRSLRMASIPRSSSGAGRPRPQCARVDGAASPKPADANSARTWTLWDSGSRRGWWYWPPKWEVVLTKPVLLSVSWPTRQAWQHRWSSMLVCAAARALLCPSGQAPALGFNGTPFLF